MSCDFLLHFSIPEVPHCLPHPPPASLRSTKVTFCCAVLHSLPTLLYPAFSVGCISRLPGLLASGWVQLMTSWIGGERMRSGYSSCCEVASAMLRIPTQNYFSSFGHLTLLTWVNTFLGSLNLERGDSPTVASFQLLYSLSCTSINKFKLS